MTSAASLQSSTPAVPIENPSPISMLPPTMIVKILELLKPADIAAFGTTCKSYNKISHDNQLWYTLFVKEFNFKPIVWTTPILTYTTCTRTWTADLAEGANLTAYKTQLNLYKIIPGALIQIKQMLGSTIV